MKRFLAGLLVGAVLGGVGATVLGEDQPAPAKAAATASDCQGVQAVVDTLMAMEGQPGVQVTDRAKEAASALAQGEPEACLTATDVDVLEP